MKINFIEIGFQHERYAEVLQLRNKILRQPLGLELSDNDLKDDDQSQFCVAIVNNQVIGCNMLTSVGENMVQLKQMAIDNNFQGKGIGNDLMIFTENIARNCGYTTIVLNARETAINFYKNLNYQTTGNPFMSVGILHVKMIKHL